MPVADTATDRLRLAKSLLALCEVDTTTGFEDRGLETLKCEVRRLESAVPGVRVDIHEQCVAPGRTNVLVTFGASPKVLLSTHLDTVPPYIAPRIEGDVVFGRGTCDAKGQIVAQLEVIRRMLVAGRRDVAWLGVIGEETDSIGAVKALELRSRLPDLLGLINSEPTKNQLATGQRGIEQLRLECEGIAAHSGSPEKGRSAILDLIDWLNRLRAEPNPSDPELGEEVFNIGIIAGGGALNVIPAYAEAKIMARTIPGSNFTERVKQAMPPSGRLERFHATQADRYPPLLDLPRAAVPFGSDAPRLRVLAKDGLVALVGPGSIDVAHTIHEHLALDDLEAGIALLERLTNHLLGIESP